MSQLEDAQRLLPEGLVLTQKMDIPVPQGRAFQAEDHRYKVSPPVLRLVRLIEVSEHDDWHGRWLKQLGDLSRRAIDGVSRPLEMGLAGPNHVYLIFDRFPATLADLIPATGLPDRRAAWSVLNQLVVALAELHGAHGDLRADHIMVDTEHLTHESRVWLGGVELGPLAHWSDGARLDPKSREVFPPEWHGELRAPTKQADVFALGLLAVELFAGREARNKVAAAKTSTTTASADVLRQRISGWQRAGRIKPLLAEAAHRPADGPAVRQRWLWLRLFEIAVSLAVVAMLFVALGLVIAWRREGTLRSERDTEHQRATIAERSLEVAKDSEGKRSKEVEALTVNVDGLKGQVDTFKGQLGEEKTTRTMAERKIDALNEEIAKLKGTPPPPQPVLSDEKAAQKLWSENLADASLEEGVAVLKSLENSANSKVREHLAAWSETVRQAWEGMKDSWTAEERNAKPRESGTRREAAYYNLRNEPWNAARRIDLVRAFWQDFEAAPGDADRKLNAIQAEVEKVPVKSWLRTALTAELKPLLSATAKWERWKSQPAPLTKAWLERIGEPWNADKVAREAATLAALDLAETQWGDVDKRRDLTWPEFQQQLHTAVTATGNAEAMTVVNTWINEFNQLSAVSFDLVSGSSPENSGTYRTIDVHVDRSRLPLDNDELGHYWSAAESHDYPTGETITVTTPWKPGQSLQLLVYGERQTLRFGARPPYIEQTFVGPIAAWRLAQARKITTREHTLILKVINLPGPPPRDELKRLKEVTP